METVLDIAADLWYDFFVSSLLYERQVRNRMIKKVIAAVLAVMLGAAVCGCAEEGKTSLSMVDDPGGHRPVVVTESTVATKEGDTTAKEDSSSAAESVTTTRTVTTEKVTTANAPEKKIEPVAVDMQPIYNSAAWFTKVNTVTSNEELKAAISRLDELIAKLGSKVGFAYQDLTNGITVTYNANKQFQTCSTIKAPYCKALLESGVGLDDMVPITKFYMAAAPEEGHLTANDLNKEFTVRKLIENSIRLSDNTAYMNLILKYGRYVFNSMQYKKGINYLLYDEYYFSMASANEMMKSYKDIYDYSLSDENGKWLIKLMTETNFNKQISAALGDKYSVAHKYGSDQETLSYSDCAICYAERPFVLCIFTEQHPETDEANQYFIDLANTFDKLNEIILS